MNPVSLSIAKKKSSLCKFHLLYVLSFIRICDFDFWSARLEVFHFYLQTTKDMGSAITNTRQMNSTSIFQDSFVS